MGAKIIDEEIKSFTQDEHLAPELEKILTIDNYERTNPYYNNHITDYVYGHTNENLDGLFDALAVKNKNVLTVGSSGDQALYAIFAGAKKVTLADANMLTRMFVELKMAAIKELDFEEFDNYFRKLYKSFFSEPQIYAKISHHLSSRAQNFWDTMMLEGKPHNVHAIFMNCIQEDAEFCKFFAKEKEYKKLQKILKKGKFELKFVYEDVKNFHEEFKNEKFDVILLSNINDYAAKLDFLFGVKFLYEDSLNEGGVIQLTSDYMYDFYSEEELNLFFKNGKFYILRNSGIAAPSLIVCKPNEKQAGVLIENHKELGSME